MECRITLYADDEPTAREAATSGFDRILDMDRKLSDYRADSELNALCAKPHDEWHPVSRDLLGVLLRARRISIETDGAFDVSIGPVVRLWREARRHGALPDEDALAAALDLVGYEMVDPNPRAGGVRLEKPGMQLDLGGIGKGWIADATIETLREAGVSRCLVNLGGDVVAGAPPPGRAGWSVRASSGLGEEPVVIELARAALATSGDVEQFVEIDGVRYSHIVDPRTGIGVTSRISASVIAPDGATADAVASAVCVLGADDVQDRLGWPWSDVALRVVTVDADGGTSAWKSPSWPDR